MNAIDSTMQGFSGAMSFALLTITSLFPMLDAVGIAPLFSTLTADLPDATARRIALRGSIYAFCLTLGFAFLGESIFDIFHLTINGLKVAGGVIFFIMGYDMLGAKINRTQMSVGMAHLTKEELEDLAITPLAIPLLCGPGVITQSIILMSETKDSWILKGAFVVGVIVSFVFTAACLVGAKRIFKLIGRSGAKVVLRLMGLFLMIIAVDSFFSGLTPLIRDMLKIS